MKHAWLGLVLIFSLECSAQTIADVARKERERQKKSRSSVVVTREGTAASAGTAVSSSATTSATSSTAASTDSKPAGPVDKNGRDETYWRGQFQKARDDAKRAEQKVAVTELKLKDLNTKMLQDSTIYNREYRLGPEIATLQKELDTARKEAEQAKQRIPQLEDELRRAGGLPGWAR